MTTASRCVPCQPMRRIQITQWSGSRACNLLAKIEFRCWWLHWREWDCVGQCHAWPLRGGSCGRFASTRQSGSFRQLSLQSKFLPSFRERYSPPNPESASIDRNLGWRNYSSMLRLKLIHDSESGLNGYRRVKLQNKAINTSGSVFHIFNSIALRTISSIINLLWLNHESSICEQSNLNNKHVYYQS